MPTNAAAWIEAKHAKLEVRPASYAPPRDDQIVVRNRAVAVNPVDWIIQVDGSITYAWLDYPAVLGADLAGEVVEVGDGVSRFRVGDRVVGLAVGTAKDRNSPAEGAFQNYTVIHAHMAAPIPDTMSYENAAVLPLGLSTAASALFQKDQLALEYPSATARPTGRTLLVWGGATSVGCNAIQLAVAAGYDVIATASPRNFDYLRKLGASQVFDYHSTTVVADLIAALKGRTIAGALAVATGSAKPCSDVVHSCKGNKVISMASPSVSFATLANGGGTRWRRRRLLLQLITSTLSLQVRAHLRRTPVRMVFASTLKDNEVGAMIFEDFLPTALADGRYVAAPEPSVIARGLEHIQAAIDTQRQGVSATKIVVAL
jgi:NADPH:quinone reductase-like Zn-dependent oxidoreductase